MGKDGEPQSRRSPHDSPEGAARPAEPPPPDPGNSIAEAIRRHAERLLAIDGIEGIDHGRTAGGTDTIRVHIRDESVRQSVPQEVDGFPVTILVTGEFEAF